MLFRSNVSYTQALKHTGDNDLSWLFRVKHWGELIQLYISGDLINQVFGFGAKSSIELTSHSKLPHNDYLKILFELGLINFTIFLYFLYIVYKSIPSSPFKIGFTIFSIYLISENLVDNYVSMMMLFTVAGTIARQENKIDN